MEKKIKILFLSVTHGAVNRGAETFVNELSSRLQNKYSVTIFTDRLVLPKRWPVLWRFYLDLQGLLILFSTLKKIRKIWEEKYDVVIPLNGGWQAFLIRLITLLYGGKMIVSGQSGKGWDDRINLLLFPNTFIATSSLLRDWGKKVNPFIAVVYIPNGVDLNKFLPIGKKKLINLPHPIIMCSGALTKEKRIELAILAVKEMKNVSLLIVGEGILKDRLNAMGKKMLGKRFLILSDRHENMPEYYRAIDLFTLPSPWYRSFEIVIVEAMASNKPVVVNDDPIRREIVGSAGFFVNPTDISLYAKSLSDALEKKWVDKPRKQSEKFSWDYIALEYEKIFVKKT